eukprot:CAMPEP_0177517208 /NCGR_PEP_ID=MMETSP0369-20130122/45848_1 /TAXON_ID=447022 ORGANISM="Scrippsiella hangoei-like, Strain SHHI-4" /NCGR_SAMPLE_ID=MMETSP0369 /ASSEMBLY_ACC=CAM_ASM_000364 /LENGTH=73 /DNA_ID=CAMNT_0018996191 /DNA_START=284 /DNA_END=502 /DNA_ORIENTATION=+
MARGGLTDSIISIGDRPQHLVTISPGLQNKPVSASSLPMDLVRIFICVPAILCGARPQAAQDVVMPLRKNTKL